LFFSVRFLDSKQLTRLAINLGFLVFGLCGSSLAGIWIAETVDLFCMLPIAGVCWANGLRRGLAASDLVRLRWARIVKIRRQKAAAEATGFLDARGSIADSSDNSKGREPRSRI